MLTIGQVLDELAGQFPGLAASKLRFFEAKGLIRPGRTSAGYRTYTAADVERLRFVLTLQRERFLPLKRIREHLEAIDRGERPSDVLGVPVPGAQLDADGLPLGVTGAPQRYSRAEIARLAEVDEALIDELQRYGLLPAPEADGYSAHGLAVVRAARTLADHGLDPRHLRPFRAAADREMGLLERVLVPMSSRRDAGTRARLDETAATLEQACVQLNSALLAEALTPFRCRTSAQPEPDPRTEAIANAEQARTPRRQTRHGRSL